MHYEFVDLVDFFTPLEVEVQERISFRLYIISVRIECRKTKMGRFLCLHQCVNI